MPRNVGTEVCFMICSTRLFTVVGNVMFYIVSNLFFLSMIGFAQLFSACSRSFYQHKKSRGHQRFCSLPAVCVSDRHLRKAPLVSKGQVLGREKPRVSPALLQRFTLLPTHQFPQVVACNISTRSSVSTSLCMYFDLMFIRCRYLSISPPFFGVVTNNSITLLTTRLSIYIKQIVYLVNTLAFISIGGI